MTTNIIVPRMDTSTSWLLLEGDSVEERLLAVIAEVLGLDKSRIQLSDSFLDLGGSQETAVMLRKACMDVGMDVTTKDILRCQTLAELQTCTAPCARQSTYTDSLESVMIAPLHINKGSQPSTDTDSRKTRSRHSSNSSVCSNGQLKTELEEVLEKHRFVSKLVTTRPKAGLLEGRLVAFLTLTGIDYVAGATSEISMISTSQVFFAGTQITTLRKFAASSLGPEPTPEAWVVLNEMPATESGDVDRRQIRTWAQNINEDIYRQILALDTEAAFEPPTTEMERSLQRMVGKVLQVPQDQVGVNFTFCQLGGDEMKAMELVARCRHESVYLNSNELLEKMTLADLAAAATQRGGLAHKWEDKDLGLFELSPMQQVYFLTPMGGDARRRTLGTAGYRFNQSHLLRLTKHCALEDIRAAVEAVVGHHPMLRCRFVQESGQWFQTILTEVSGSYAFNHHSVSSDDDVKSVVESSQAAINIQNGPVFGVDYFLTHDGQQLIYLLAHHLVVDLPSWRLIIHDLDELFENGSLVSQRSMPYFRWIECQKLAAQASEADIPHLPTTDLDQSYWGLKDVPNSYEDAIETSFSLTSELSSILQSTCNQAFDTESVDIYLAALTLSFTQTFTDRPSPVVWNQEQGRESWNPGMDISETVGWFTTLTPMLQMVHGLDDFVQILRKVKDLRRMSPARESRYLASKFFNPKHKDSLSLDCPFELVFSYAGCIRQLERPNGVLEQVTIPGRTLASRTSDIGPTVGRIAVFEVNAMVDDQGAARVKFVYNRYSKHQERISAWISNCEHLLLEAIGRLRYHAQELTLSDVPRLDVTYDGLSKLHKNSIDSLKLSTIRDIEAVYPVTVAQQSILISQAIDPGRHILQYIHEFLPSNGDPVDTSLLCLAWQLVTARYSALRTVFMKSVTSTGLYDQIILRRVSPEMLFVDTVPPEDPIYELNSLPNMRPMDAKPPHRLTVCKTPTKTLLKLDISAATCDATSVRILLRDLCQTYATQRAIPGPVRFSYPDYIEFLKTARKGESISYWIEVLKDLRHCLFPWLLTKNANVPSSNADLELAVTSEELSAFVRRKGVSGETLIRLAWALVLRSFTGARDPCFACSTSGREGLVDGLSGAVGSLGSIIPCRIMLLPDDLVDAALRTVDARLKSGLLHQFVSISEIQHALGLKGGTRLFNTFVSYAEEPISLHNKFVPSKEPELRSVARQYVTDFDISLHVRNFSGKLTVDVSSCIMSEGQAMNVANTFDVAIRAILSSGGGLLDDVSLFSDRDYAQIVAWSNDRTESDVKINTGVVHDLVVRHAAQHPDTQAVSAWDGDLSYRHLVDNATRLAHYLVDWGVGPHAVVPVVLEKSRWAPVVMLAVLKTGAAFVPIDAEDLSCIQSIFEQLNARVAISCESASLVLGNLFEKVIVMNDDLFSQMPYHTESLPSIATPEDTACIMFTATSTKEARGVAFSHAALSTAFLAQGTPLRITNTSRVLQLSSFNVDIALAEVFTTLTHGGCVCIPSPAERLHDYVGAVQRMRVSWSYMTPILSRKLDSTLVPTLKVVCFRTRGLDEDTYAPWAGKANVVLAYGALDICPLGISFFNVVDTGDLMSIGKPLAGSFWIVNPEDHRKLVPLGAVGELVIEGPTLGCNYPYADIVKSLPTEPEVNAGIKTKYFKTGHRVRYLHGGVIQFVSSKGGNLEMGGRIVNVTEIEQHIRRCLGQSIDVMVEAITFRGAKDVPVLAAFIELGGRPFDGPDDLLNATPATKEAVYLAKRLVETGLKTLVSPNLIPSVYIPVQNLPLSPSLKVDRRRLQKMIHGLSKEHLLALAEPPNTLRVQSMDLKPLPLTQTEDKMRTIWAGVLVIEPASIGSADRFFDIGGDEVLATRLVVACRHEGITVSIEDIMKNTALTELCRSTTAEESTLPELYSPVVADIVSGPTPQRQQGSITESFVDKIIAPKLGVERRVVKEVAQTSAMQTRYIESGMLRGRANIDYFTFAFSGAIDWARLEEACQLLVVIHPILRTAFTPNNRKVFQAVFRSYSVPFERHSCPSWRLQGLTSKLITKDQLASIAFNKPITKFMLVDGGKQSALVMRLSKAQYDDLSIAILVKDLKRLYDNTDNPPRRPSHCEFVRSIHTIHSPGVHEYWRGLLAGATMTRVINGSKPYHLSAHGKTLRRKILVGSLSNLGISFETVLKSAWAMVLANLSASADVVFGEIVEGRHVRLSDGNSVASVMGPTLNEIPVRIQFPDSPLSPLELLQYVHGQRIAGIPFENLGFLRIVEKCTPWPYWTRFSTVVQHRHEDTSIVPGEPKSFHLGTASCRLDVVESKAQDLHDFFVHSIMRRQGRVELGLRFCADRIPGDLAEYALRLLCETISLLTSVSIMQPILPSAHQYRALAKRIPLEPPPVQAKNVITEPRSPPSLLSPDLIRTIQTVISKSWTATLNPLNLGVPEDHLHQAAFYDLWGSLIPAAQIAAQLNRNLSKLGLPGLDSRAPIVSMEDIIDHPTMLTQFELIVTKMIAAAGSPTRRDSDRPEQAAVSAVAATRRPSVSAAASVAKSIRRLASTVRSSSGSSTTTKVTAREPAPAPTPTSITANPPGIAIISPLSPAPQLPLLPPFSPVVEEGFGSALRVSGSAHSGPGGNASSAESMTTGSTASSRHSDEGEEGERADILAPLRSEIQGGGAARVRVSVHTQGFRGRERDGERGDEMVSPLSAASGTGMRLWDVVTGTRKEPGASVEDMGVVSPGVKYGVAL